MSTNPAPARTRRPAGTPTGGQFAPEAHAEPEVTVGPPQSAPESMPTVAPNGTICWRDAGGHLHRTDGPAVEAAYGRREWYVGGQLHRTDGPAIEAADGHLEWYTDGHLHRTDGPAVEYPDGLREWWVNGRLHRTDGPAVDRGNGRMEWWVDGAQLTEAQFQARFLGSSEAAG